MPSVVGAIGAEAPLAAVPGCTAPRRAGLRLGPPPAAGPTRSSARADSPGRALPRVRLALALLPLAPDGLGVLGLRPAAPLVASPIHRAASSLRAAVTAVTRRAAVPVLRLEYGHVPLEPDRRDPAATRLCRGATRRASASPTSDAECPSPSGAQPAATDPICRRDAVAPPGPAHRAAPPSWPCPARTASRCAGARCCCKKGCGCPNSGLPHRFALPAMMGFGAAASCFLLVGASAISRRTHPAPACGRLPGSASVPFAGDGAAWAPLPRRPSAHPAQPLEPAERHLPRPAGSLPPRVAGPAAALAQPPWARCPCSPRLPRALPRLPLPAWAGRRQLLGPAAAGFPAAPLPVRRGRGGRETLPPRLLRAERTRLAAAACPRARSEGSECSSLRPSSPDPQQTQAKVGNTALRGPQWSQNGSNSLRPGSPPEPRP